MCTYKEALRYVLWDWVSTYPHSGTYMTSAFSTSDERKSQLMSVALSLERAWYITIHSSTVRSTCCTQRINWGIKTRHLPLGLWVVNPTLHGAVLDDHQYTADEWASSSIYCLLYLVVPMELIPTIKYINIIPTERNECKECNDALLFSLLKKHPQKRVPEGVFIWPTDSDNITLVNRTRLSVEPLRAIHREIT